MKQDIILPAGLLPDIENLQLIFQIVRNALRGLDPFPELFFFLLLDTPCGFSFLFFCDLRLLNTVPIWIILVFFKLMAAFEHTRMLLQQGLCDTSLVLGKVAVSDNRFFGDIQLTIAFCVCRHFNPPIGLVAPASNACNDYLDPDWGIRSIIP